MLTEIKRKLTAISGNSYFSESLELLTTKDQLSHSRISYLLSTAILFLESYQNDNRHKSYLDFGYYIILRCSLITKDYKPLYDISVTAGFYPISEYILRNNLIQLNIDDAIIQSGIERFRHPEDYIETLEQYSRSNDFFKDSSLEKTYLAPTSYGKSSLIVESIKRSLVTDKKIAIVVPTKSLLMQTYRLIREAELGKKILVHDEMYNGEDEFIAVFTQERALRLINRKSIIFDLIFIDEAHNIFKKDDRSILLSRLISRNRINNEDQKVIYLSPLIENSTNLKFNDQQEISSHVIHFNIKEPRYFEYKLDGSTHLYNRFINKFYKIGESNSMLNYIVSNAKSKNFLYNYRPIKIEKLAKDLTSYLEQIEISNEISTVINILKKEVHPKFYAQDCLKYGVVYIHGKLPDIIKEYLEFKFKSIPEIKFIVANSVILEGMNLPIDNLFILNTNNLQGKELVNLIGRVNRLNSIFSEHGGGLDKLEPSVHFVNNVEHNRVGGNMRNKMKLLRNRSFVDRVENPILENFDIDKLDNDHKKEALSKIENENLLLNPDNDPNNELLKYLIESGISEFYDDVNEAVLVLKDVISNLAQENSAINIKWQELSVLEKINELFITNQTLEIRDFEIKRLRNQEARNYYENHILLDRKKSINENVVSLVTHYESKAASSNYMQYFGPSYGEEALEDGERSTLYVNLTTKSEAELVNLAIVKLKMEDDFVSFKLNKFIVMLYDYNLITKEEYHLFIYGTTDENKIALSKYGLNIGLIDRLSEDGQLTNISLDQSNNIVVNDDFNLYLETLNDLLKFEIRRFL